MTRDELIAGFTVAAEGSEPVEALLLAGSLGRGEGDRWSDVDLIVVTPAEAHARFVASLRGWASAVAPPVLWRQPYTGVPLFHAVTADYLRYDITVAPETYLVESADRVRPLVDRSGVFGRLPRTRAAPPIAPAAVCDLAEEFLRILGLLPVGVGRGDYAAAATGVGLLRQHLQALMLLEQRPVTPPGALAVTRLLTPEDVRTLEAAAGWPATRSGAIDGTLSLAAAFLPRARRLAREVGASWPEALEAAVRDHLRRELDLTLPA
jgi:hypothetical protein